MLFLFRTIKYGYGVFLLSCAPILFDESKRGEEYLDTSFVVEE